MKKKQIITIAIIMLFLPLILILLAWLILKYFIFDNPSFWYAYMTYFGTITLASVALWQNENAALMNERITQQQLRQKIGYFSLRQNEGESRRINKFSDIQVGQIYTPDFKLDESKEKVLNLSLKNIGEDLIIISEVNVKINDYSTIIPCEIGTVFKDEEITFSIDNSSNYQAKELVISLVLTLKNTAGVKYKQIIGIMCVNKNSTVQGTYSIRRFTTNFIFDNINH